MKAEFARAFPPETWSGVTVLAAVSGGPDSMALLRLLHALQAGGLGRIVAAHFNHGTRGADSDADEAFVRETCESLGLGCEIGTAAAGEFDRLPDGFEQAARTARYRFLEEAAGRLGARYIATGHTADDQAETILHRLLRGTGLSGLSGIPTSRPLNQLTTLVRPLLPFRRAEIVAYLAEIGQPFREDATNTDPRYTRNRLRHELLPQLAADYNPQVVESVLRLGSQAAEARQVIDELAGKLAARFVEASDAAGVVISCDGLAAISPYIIREVLITAWRGQGWPEQAMTYDKWQSLAALALGGVDAKQEFPGGVIAKKRGSELRLTRAKG